MTPYYQDESATIYLGNNVDVLAGIADSSIDLTVTSPPYDNLRTYNGYEFDFESVAKELYRVTKIGGVVVWVVADATIDGSETGTSFKQALYFKEIGFNLHDTMIYRSGKPPLTHNRYEQEFEYMFVLSKGKPKTFNPIKILSRKSGEIKRRNHGDIAGAKLEKNSAVRYRDEITIVGKTRIKGNIWDFATGYMGSTKDLIAFDHPAIFPESLANDHICSWSNPGDTILDPFCGSGTTGKMAIKNGCKFIGIEISEEYCALSVKRLSQGAFNFEQAV